MRLFEKLKWQGAVTKLAPIGVFEHFGWSKAEAKVAESENGFKAFFNVLLQIQIKK